MTKDYITVTLNVHLEGGDRFTTGFNILPSMLLNKSIQQFVDDYYVGSSYTYSDETTRKIVMVDVVTIEDKDL